MPGARLCPCFVVSGLQRQILLEAFHKKGGDQVAVAAGETKPWSYESFRLVKTLTQLAEVLGSERQASVSREISKFYEETKRGSLSELAEHFSQHPPKGEIVLVVAGE